MRSYRVVYLLVGALAAYGLVGAALSPATRDPRNQADVAKRQPANPLQEVGAGGRGRGGVVLEQGSCQPAAGGGGRGQGEEDVLTSWGGWGHQGWCKRGPETLVVQPLARLCSALLTATPPATVCCARSPVASWPRMRC